MKLAVVIPAFNEAESIVATLRALARQTDRDFTVVLVDNGSTDDTAEVAERAAAEVGLALTVVPEPQKGTGAAADTGVRHAITHGATHVLRTDADTLPAREWVAVGRAAFADGADLITGPLRARRDELRLKLWERTMIPAVVGFCQLFGRLRPSNRGPEFKGPYRMSPGCNLGVSAAAYEASGGFPRTRIEELHEDRALVNAVRRVSDEVRHLRGLAVYSSVRRLRAYGLLGTLRWYLDHSNAPGEIDVRSPHRPGAETRREQRLLRAAHPGIARVVDLLLRHRRVLRVPGMGVLVADPSVARAVLLDGEHFVKSGKGSSGALWTPVLGERVLFNMDGEEHRRLRRTVGELFTPRFVREVGERAARPLIDGATDRLRAGQPVDVAALALDVAASVIAEILGLDDGRLTVIEISAQIEQLISWRDTELSPRQVRRAAELVAPVGAAAEESFRTARPGTVLGLLREKELAAEEARSLAIALFLSGTSTVSSALPRIIDALGERGLLRRGAWSASGLDVTRAVTEGLRLTAPSLATLRRTARTTTVGKVPVRPGDRILILLWWALRLDGGYDPQREMPASMRSLWFGAGPHFCLGAPLAVAELELLAAALLEVADDVGLRVTGRRPARRVLLPRYARFTVEVE